MSKVIQATKPNHGELLNELRAALAVNSDRMVMIECHHADELGATVVNVNGVTFQFLGGHPHMERAVPRAEWRDGPVADEAIIQAQTLLERLLWDRPVDDFAAGQDVYREAAMVAGAAAEQ